MKAGLNIHDLKRMHSFMEETDLPVKLVAKKFGVTEEYVKANTKSKLEKWKKEAAAKRQAEVAAEAKRQDLAATLLQAANQAVAGTADAPVATDDL